MTVTMWAEDQAAVIAEIVESLLVYSHELTDDLGEITRMTGTGCRLNWCRSIATSGNVSTSLDLREGGKVLVQTLKEGEKIYLESDDMRMEVHVLSVGVKTVKLGIKQISGERVEIVRSEIVEVDMEANT
jgi:sRNA-binding carbon storage regulator CsrA